MSEEEQSASSESGRDRCHRYSPTGGDIAQRVQLGDSEDPPQAPHIQSLQFLLYGLCGGPCLTAQSIEFQTSAQPDYRAPDVLIHEDHAASDAGDSAFGLICACKKYLYISHTY